MMKRTSLRAKLILRFALLSFLSSTVLGSTLYFYFRAQVQQQLKQHLLDVVSLAVNQVPGDEHALIKQEDGWEGTSYQSVRSSLESVQMTGNRIASIYTMR